MEKKCCLCGITSSNLKYYRFPYHMLHVVMWINKIRKWKNDFDFVPTSASLLCELHFNKNDISQNKEGFENVIPGRVPSFYKGSEDLTDPAAEEELQTQQSIPDELSLKQQVSQLNSDLVNERKVTRDLKREVNRWKLRYKTMKSSKDTVFKQIEVIQHELNIIRESATINRDLEQIEKDARVGDPKAGHLLDQIKKYISVSSNGESTETKEGILHEAIDIKTEPEYY